MNNENNDLNNQVEQPVKTNSSKNSKVILIIMLILLLIIVILSILLIKNPFNKDSNANKNDNGVVENNNDGQTEDKEIKLTDTVKLDYIKNLVSIVEETPFDTSNIEFPDNRKYTNIKSKTIYALDNVKSSDITTTMATKALLYNSRFDTEVKFDSDENGKKYMYDENGNRKYSNCKDVYGIYKIDVEQKLSAYKSLFGYDQMDLTVENVDGDIFISYYYDNEDKVYYVCAGAGGYYEGATSSTYIYDVTEDNKNIYAYVAYGAKYYEGPDTDGALSYYTDYTLTNEYTKEVKADEDGNFINETNYQDFDKYKYTFTKNSDGTYTFSSMSKIK